MTERQFERALTAVLLILVCLLLIGHRGQRYVSPAELKDGQQSQMEPLSEDEKYSYMGVFEAEAYCAEDFPHSCNENGQALTDMGGIPVPGRTVAVDPAVIPLGSLIKVKCGADEWILTASDTVESIEGNKICLVVPTHEEAYKWNTKSVQVWMIEERDGI